MPSILPPTSDTQLEAEPYYSDEFVTLYLGDCREVTAWLAADCLISDPPYGLDSNLSSGFRGKKKASGHVRVHAKPAWDETLEARDAALALWGSKPYAVFGGTDDPTNLVAACQDCNAGKSSMAPDAPLVADVDAAQLRWRAAIKKAQEQVAATEKGIDEQFEIFKAQWNRWDENDLFLDANAPEKFRYWLSDGMTTEALCECIDIAWSAYGVRPRNTFSYLCGVVRKKLEEIHEVAQALIAAEDATAQEAS